MTRALARVIVIGAGVAGLACALAAGSHDLQVQVFDEAPSPPRESSGHVEVVPSMLRDLVALGIADECTRAGFAYNGIDLVDRYGRVVVELAIDRLAGLRYPAALGISRSALLSLLEGAARARGVVIDRGSRVTAVEPPPAGPLHRDPSAAPCARADASRQAAALPIRCRRAPVPGATPFAPRAPVSG